MAKRMKAGWYGDPEAPGRERYWDGARWTSESRIAPPRPERPRKGGGTFLKVLAAVVVAAILLVVGCVALVGVGLNAEEEGGITRAQFRSVQLGATQQEVEERFGAPESAQEFESRIPELQDRPSRSSCVYYPEKGRKILEGATFQFCFEEGRLRSKNAYG